MKATLRASIRSLSKAERAGGFPLHAYTARLEDTPLDIGPRILRGLITKAPADAAEQAVREYMFAFVRTNEAQGQFLRISAGHAERFAAPLPPAWRRALRAMSIPVDGLACMLQLYRKAFRDWAGAAVLVLRLAALQKGFIKAPPAPYGVLVNAGAASLLVPPARRNGTEFDYLSWYQSWPGRRPGLTHTWVHSLADNARIDPRSSFVDWPLPELASTRARLRLLATGCFNAATSLLGLLAGRWWAGCLLREVTWYDYAEALPAESLAGEYWFQIANAMYGRPLWTYLVQARGARVGVVYYSANSMNFSATTPPQPARGNGERIAAWPEAVVMSADQAQNLGSLRERPVQCSISPNIGHNDDGQPVPDLGAAPVASVFDVVPSRIRRRAAAGLVMPYYRAPICRKFLEDVEAAAAACGATVALKSKRNNTKTDDPTYTALKDRMYRRGTVRQIPAGIAPQRLIAASDFSVSLPFTSPANIAQAAGKPSIFYDPTGTLAASRPRLHDVDVISSRDALFAWFAAEVERVRAGATPGGSRSQGAARSA